MSFLIAGAGFFNDAYDLFVMNTVNVVLTEQYPNDYTSSMMALVSTTVLVGAVAGQLVFGYIADTIGRRRTMIISCLLLICGGILSAASYGPTTTSLLVLLAVYRGLLGVGIGAEYPLSATATAEGAVNTKERGPQVALTFSLQGWGSLTAALCGNILVQLFANTPPYSSGNLECIWRILFGIGALPAIFVFYWRLKAKESSAFVANQERREREGNNQKTMPKLRFIVKHYGLRLLGTAGTWFLFDIVFYAQNLFAGTVLKAVGVDETESSLQVVTLKNVLLAIVALPGYLTAVFTINRLGRKVIQMQGFILSAAILGIMGIFWDQIVSMSALFVLMYALTFFFFNFGPNTTTFVLPTETFPTAIRASCHGFSAAMGKLGATLGAMAFAPLADEIGINIVFILCGVVSLLGALLTYFCVQDSVVDLQDLDEEFAKKLAAEDDDDLRNSFSTISRYNASPHTLGELSSRSAKYSAYHEQSSTSLNEKQLEMGLHKSPVLQQPQQNTKLRAYSGNNVPIDLSQASSLPKGLDKDCSRGAGALNGLTSDNNINSSNKDKKNKNNKNNAALRDNAISGLSFCDSSTPKVEGTLTPRSIGV